MRSVLESAILAFALAAVMTACSSSGTTMNPPGAQIAARLYVANFTNSGQFFPGSLLAFALPFAGNSPPLVTLAPPAANEGPIGLALLGKQLFVGYQQQVAVYKLPLTPSSVPAYQITPPVAGTVQGLAFDSSGNLIAGVANNVYVFIAPLSSSSSSAFNFTLPNGAGCCLQQFAVHGSQIAIADDKGINDHIYVYALPLTAASVPTASMTTGAGQSYSGVAFDSSGKLYAAGVSPQQIEVYAPPFTSLSVPITKISTATLASPQSLCFDSQGNLYYTTSKTATLASTLYEYVAPFTAASTPAGQTTISFGALLGNCIAGT
ncbi:MAG TPA: hypothetical protein VIN40_11270 [Candidatus Tyrphobacter sp.]